MTRRLFFAAWATLTLSGCIADIQPHVASIDEANLGLGRAAPLIREDWWKAFGDPQLNRLIEIGLENNPTLEAALARLDYARGQIAADQSKLLPQINGSSQVNRTRLGDKLLPDPIGGHDGTLIQAGASLSWDLDIFGKQHAVVRSTAAKADAVAFDSDAAHLAVAVAIAQTYVNYARASKQINVVNGIVATRQQSLLLVKSRGNADLTSNVEVEANKTLLAQAQQAEARATRDRDTYIHALAALLGRGAEFYAELRAPTLSFGRSARVPKSIPADLLGRRPDILAARARIDAAVGGREAAAAAFLPNINISTLAGLAAFGAGNLALPGAGYYLAGPALQLPIFEGGKLRAQYAQATADLDSAVADYNNVVVGSVRETADAITNVKAADKDLVEEGQVVTGLRNIVRLNQDRVSAGLSSSLDELDAGFRSLEAEQDLVLLQAAALNARLQLIAALGGGFTLRAPVVALTPEKDIHR